MGSKISEGLCVPNLESPDQSTCASTPPSGTGSGDDMSDTSSIPPGSINADNYISVTEGCRTVLTASELSECVEKCKDLVLETQECSDERKWLVRRLIELRHRLQQALEGELNDKEKDCVLHGHHFRLKYEPKLTTTIYCDRCCCTIWHLIQSWYECVDCLYKSHVSCLNKTMRICAHISLSENPSFETRICPEIGLSKQNYLCAECRTHITISLPKGTYTLTNPFSIVSGLVEARKCDYTGLYYCPSCHWNSLSVIPSRVVKSWDFEPRPVSRVSYQLIRLAKNRPIITLDPMLYQVVEELAIVKKKREELSIMKQYIATCRQALETGFYMKELEWRRHIIHSTSVFSLDDLIDIHQGKLLLKINEIYNSLLRHITVDCMVCKLRGYRCQLCNNKKEILFAFDTSCYTCPTCSSVLHKSCWLEKKMCPKCIRTQERKDKEALEMIDNDPRFRH